MGGPLSPILSEIAMTYFEQQHLTFSTSELVCWFRYVDDVLLVWNSSERRLHSFVSRLNAVNPKIQFKLELENQGKLNFLDITVHKCDESLRTSMFFKPTYTGRLVNFSSHHSRSTKKGIAVSLFLRALSLTTVPNLVQPTIDYIKSVLVLNDFPTSLITSSLQTALQKFDPSYQPTSNTDDKKWFSIPYVKGVSEKLRSVCSEVDLALTFRSSTTFASMYYNPSQFQQTIPDLTTEGCIYAIPCSCGSWYVGETGRPLSARLKEHKRYTQPQYSLHPNLINLSAIAFHHHTTKHSIQWDQLRILATDTYTHTRKIKEAFFIRAFQPRINLSDGLEIPDQWYFLFSKQFKPSEFHWLSN